MSKTHDYKLLPRCAYHPRTTMECIGSDYHRNEQKVTYTYECPACGMQTIRTFTLDEAADLAATIFSRMLGGKRF